MAADAGLSNQGATCYLNALLQTLYHTPPLRTALLSLTLEELGHTDPAYTAWLVSDDAVGAEAGRGAGGSGQDSWSAGDPNDLPVAAVRAAGELIAGVLGTGIGLDPEYVRYCVVKHAQGEAISAALGDDPDPLTHESLLELCVDPDNVVEFEEDVEAGDWSDPVDMIPSAVTGGPADDDAAAAAGQEEVVPPPSPPDRVRPIPFALQRLFAGLDLHGRDGVLQGPAGTDFLTSAFGFSGSDASVQHDIGELTRILLDILERQLVASRLEPLVGDLLRGETARIITCSTCGASRSHNEPFLDVSLPTAGASDLDAALIAWTAPEVMDGDNALSCDVCGDRQPATIRNVFTKLPPLLTVQLNRFAWGPSGRVKLNDPLGFPKTLHMASMLSGPFLMDPDTAAAHAARAAADAPDPAAALAAASAPGPDPDDLAFSEFGLFSGPPAPSAAAEAGPGARVFTELFESSLPPGPPDAAPYSLYAIILHSGGAHGGHYHALIRCGPDGSWWDFNDAKVTPITDEEIIASYGVSGSSRESAYMLFYAQDTVFSSSPIEPDAAALIPAHKAFWTDVYTRAAAAEAARNAESLARRKAAAAARSSSESGVSSKPTRPPVPFVVRTPHVRSFDVVDIQLTVLGSVLVPSWADTASLPDRVATALPGAVPSSSAALAALVPTLGAIASSVESGTVDVAAAVEALTVVPLADLDACELGKSNTLAHTNTLVLLAPDDDADAAVEAATASVTSVPVLACGNAFVGHVPTCVSLASVKTLLCAWLNDELDARFSPHATALYALADAPGYTTQWALDATADPLVVGRALDADGGSLASHPAIDSGFLLAELDDVVEPLGDVSVVVRDAVSPDRVGPEELAAGTMSLASAQMTTQTTVGELMGLVASAAGVSASRIVLRPTDAACTPRPPREVFVSKSRSLAMYYVRPHSVLVAEPGHIVAVGHISLRIAEYKGYPTGVPRVAGPEHLSVVALRPAEMDAAEFAALEHELDSAMLDAPCGMFSPAHYAPRSGSELPDREAALFTGRDPVSISSSASIKALYAAVAESTATPLGSFRLWVLSRLLDPDNGTGTLRTLGITDGSVLTLQHIEPDAPVSGPPGTVLVAMYAQSPDTHTFVSEAWVLPTDRDVGAKYDHYAHLWRSPGAPGWWLNHGDIVVSSPDQAAVELTLPKRVQSATARSTSIFAHGLSVQGMAVYVEERGLKIDAGGW